MDTTAEAALILAELGRPRDYELEKAIGRALGVAHDEGSHNMKLKIALWGDVEPEERKFIITGR